MDEFRQKMAASSVRTIGHPTPSLEYLYYIIAPMEHSGRLYGGMEYREFLDQIGNIGHLYYYNLWANLYRDQRSGSANPNEGF